MNARGERALFVPRLEVEHARSNAQITRVDYYIEYPLDIPIVSYLGDTQYADFSQLDYIAKSKILIAECTFYEGEHTTRAQAGKHMHIDELAMLLGSMQNEYIIITHTTQRTAMHEIRKMLKEAMPDEIHKKITILPRRPRSRPARQ